MEQKFEVPQNVDADVVDKLIDKGEAKTSVLSDKEEKAIKEIFENAINDKNNTVTVETMATDDLPVTISLPEFMRRMKDMQAAGGGGPMMFGDLPVNLAVAVNANHTIIQKILAAKKKDKKIDLASNV